MTERTSVTRIADPIPDGTVYAGSLNGKALYTTPKDGPLTYTFDEAAKYAQKLNREKYLGHDDWRVPTKGELNVLFENHAAIGGFDESGLYPGGWYWSSDKILFGNAWAQRFSDGHQDGDFKSGDSSLRCVRG